MKVLRPQDGPQMTFALTKADIAFYGGAAGGGKSFALLFEPIRNLHVPGFGGVIFRREFSQVTVEGGLWDESMKIYPGVCGVPNMSDRYWKWKCPSPENPKQENAISFAGLEYEKDVLKYQGAQICYMGFDELTHFTRFQFFYMMSRNRSVCGVRPYIRASMNPEKKSWVRAFIEWYLFPKGHPRAGKPDPSKSGIIRYFIVVNDKVIWGESKKELREKYGDFQRPLSFTFIAASLADNKILTDSDPGYKARLMALSKVEREKLLDGSWDAEEISGEVFKRGYFDKVAQVPGKIRQCFRVWDRAATVPTEANPDPDWTRGVKIARLDSGKWIVLHVESAQTTAGEVTKLIKRMAIQDGPTVSVGLFQDPGSAGKGEAEYMVTQLPGFDVRVMPQTQDKVTRARPLSAQAEFKNVLMLAGPWNEEFLSEMESFPDGGHDDIVDAAAGGFSLTVDGSTGTFTNEMTIHETKESIEW